MGIAEICTEQQRIGIKAKKCQYEGVIVPTVLYRAEACGMRSAERRKVNVLEMKCLRSFIGVSRMYRVSNEDVPRRAGIKVELASRADQRAVRWFGHVESRDEYRMTRRWCEGGLGKQWNDDAG